MQGEVEQKVEARNQKLMNGEEPPQQQTQALNDSYNEYLGAAAQEMRVAAGNARESGGDVNAALDQQAQAILERAGEGEAFDPQGLGEQINEIRNSLKNESAEVSDLRREQYDAAQESGSEIEAATTARDEAQAAADQAIEAAEAYDNPSYAERHDPDFETSRRSAQQNATELQAVADEAQAALTRLELEASEEQSGYNSRIADAEVRDAQDALAETRQAAGGVATPEQQAKIDQAEQDLLDAIDKQNFHQDVHEVAAARLESFDAEAALKDAQAAWDAASANQPKEGEDGYNRAFWAKPGSDDGRQVEFRDGKWQFKEVKDWWFDEWHDLPPETADLWEAQQRADRADARLEDAEAAWDTTYRDQFGDPSSGLEHGRLDAKPWVAREEEIGGKLRTANQGVTEAQTALDDARERGATASEIDRLERDLGAKLQTQQTAQAESDALGSLQDLRQARIDLAAAQRADTDAGASEPSQAVIDAQAEVDRLEGEARTNVSEALSQKEAAGTLAEQETEAREGLQNSRDALADQEVNVDEARTAWETAGAEDKAAKQVELDRELAEYDRLELEVADYESRIELIDAERELLTAQHEYDTHDFVERRETTRQGMYGVEVTDYEYPDGFDRTADVLPPSTFAEASNTELPVDDGYRTLSDGTKVSEDGNTWVLKDGTVVERRDDGYYATFQDQLPTTTEVTTYGSYGSYGTYQKPETVKINSVTARVWEAQAHAADARSSRTEVEARLATHAQDHPPAATEQPPDALQFATNGGRTGQDNVPTLNLSEDLTTRKTEVDQAVVDANTAVETAQGTLDNATGDTAALEDALQQATDRRDLLVAEQTAINAAIRWQDANRELRLAQADVRAGRDPERSIDELQRDADDARTEAVDRRSDWFELHQQKTRGGAQDRVDTAQTAHDAWLADHAYLRGTGAERQSDTWQALQQARTALDGAERDLTATASPGAWHEQQQFIAENLDPADRQDPKKLYELFNRNPEVMAQALINDHFVMYGGMPSEMQGRTHIANTVAASFGWQPSVALDPTQPDVNARMMVEQNLFTDLNEDQQKMLDAAVQEIVDVGGENARLTVVPVVYATEEAGIVKTALFKVEHKDEPGFRYIDEQGWSYKDIDDFRANNSLPAEGVTLVMPEDGEFKVQDDGNIELLVADARTETGFETFRREWHVDTVVGVVGVVAGVVLIVASAGTLTAAGAGLIVGGSMLYGGVTAVSDLHTLATHGQSLNPIENERARMSQISLLGIALGAGAMGSAVRTASAATRGAAASAATWGTRATYLGRGALATGVAGGADQARYLAVNWEHMSGLERGEAILNLSLSGIDIMTPAIVGRLKQPAGMPTTQNAGGPAPMGGQGPRLEGGSPRTGDGPALPPPDNGVAAQPLGLARPDARGTHDPGTSNALPDPATGAQPGESRQPGAADPPPDVSAAPSPPRSAEPAIDPVTFLPGVNPLASESSATGSAHRPGAGSRSSENNADTGESPHTGTRSSRQRGAGRNADPLRQVRESREVRGIRRSDLGDPPARMPDTTAQAGGDPPNDVLVLGHQWPDLLPQLRALSGEGDVFVYRFERSQPVDTDAPVDLKSSQLKGWGIAAQGERRARWLGQGEPDGPPGFNIRDSRHGLGEAPLSADTFLVVSRTPPSAVRDAGGFQGVRWVGDDAAQLSVRGLGPVRSTAEPAPSSTPDAVMAPRNAGELVTQIETALAQTRQSDKALQKAHKALQKEEARTRQLEDRLHHGAEALRTREQGAQRLLREAREAEARAEAARNTEQAPQLLRTAQRLRKEADAAVARAGKDRAAMLKDVEALAAAEVKTANSRVEETTARHAFVKDQLDLARLAQTRAEADVQAARTQAERARLAADDARGPNAFITRTAAARAERRAQAVERAAQGIVARTARLEDALIVTGLSKEGATRKQQLVETETTEAVRHFKDFIDRHGELAPLSATRRVLDADAAAAATREVGGHLGLAREALADAQARDDAARAYETTKTAEAEAAWTTHRDAQADPGTARTLTRDEMQPLLQQAVDAHVAARAADVSAGRLQHAKDVVDALETAYRQAREAEAAVREAVAFAPHGVDETVLTRTVDPADALLAQVTRGIVDDKTIAAGSALVKFDEAAARVTALLDVGPSTSPRTPRTVSDGLTYSDPKHPAYPDLPKDFWPNVHRGDRPDQYIKSRIERAALALVNKLPVGKNAYEQLFGVKLKPGDFKVDPTVVERADIPEGLEHVIADIHSHDRGYDHRGATKAERDGLRDRMTLLNDGWRAIERYYFAVKPLTAMQGVSSATSRILHGSIPQMSDCGASHYSGIDAGPLNMKRAQQMDTEVAKDFMSQFERYRTARAEEQAALARGDAEAAAKAQKTADEALRSAARADMSMTGVDPSKEDAAGHARQMLLEHPGVFKFVGELTIKKEMVDVLLGKESFEIDAASMDHFMAFANETGLGVLIHCDWGRHALDANDLRPTGTKTAYEHFDQLIDLVAKYPDANIVLAHTGLGRLVRPDTSTQAVTITRNVLNPDRTLSQVTETREVPTHMAKVYEAMERAPHVKFDISWNDVAEAYINDPGMRRAMVDFIVLYQDRILFGSDTVKPVNAGHYNQALTTYLPLFADVAMRDPGALWMVLRGNYETVNARAEASVADWTRNQLRAQGREGEIAAMDEMLATLRTERERMIHGYEGVGKDGQPEHKMGALDHFNQWVDQLYANRYATYGAQRSLPDPATGQAIAPRHPMEVAVRPESAAIHEAYADPVPQHWQATHAHGQGTPRGKFDTVPARVVAGTLATVGTGSALAGGSATLAATPDGVDPHLNASGFEARAGMGLARSLYSDGVRLGWEQIFEEGKVTHESLDRFVNRIVRNGKAFGLSDDKLKAVARLTEQFRVDYAYLANKPVDEASGWSAQQKFNAVMATVGQYQIGVDRALGMQASSINGLDPRTGSGQMFRLVTGATYGLNVAYAAAALTGGDLSAVQALIQGGFGASNGALMVNTFAGLGSGVMKSNWEARTPFRWNQTLGMSGLSLSGAVWTLNDAANFFAQPSLHGAGEVAFGSLFTYATARQADVEWRKLLGLPVPGPTQLSRPGYWLAAGVGLRVALMHFDDEQDASEVTKWEPPKASGLPPLFDATVPDGMGLEAWPDDPALPDPGDQRPPGMRPAPVYVELGAGAGRHLSLWGAAEANVERLLTTEEQRAAAARGGEVAVVADALVHLFQLNRERGFRRELMDGVATPARGDPDAVDAGTRLNVNRVGI